ncbi:hypothetical protein I2I11_17045 [Pontibacter sp. 172403-2]|uniref:DUF7793 family protein n=1 Tax=Pontibacter rufus TaxID=2791028 RepID=UPI0018B0083D|nr:hypothetical protein [Pontibacter sp. 172403-2]MBF9255011.1 hypothetical protein [Pontibacter sp. 172403-2]
MANLGESFKTKFKETEHLKFLCQDGVMYCDLKEINMLDIVIAKTCVKDRLEFVAGESYPCVFDITKVKQSTKEARDYLANEGNELVSASAILVSSPVLRMMANFYIMVNKPLNPTRMFTNRDNATEWLSQFKR